MEKGEDAGSSAILPKHIFIGNSPRVRNVCNTISSLNEYSRGKEESELFIEETFSGQNSCIIKPTFIYVGDKFGWNPPRLPNGLEDILEALPGLYPIQATSEIPDLPGVAFEAPVNVKAVAGAIVNVAIGIDDDSCVFETREGIIMAASKRSAVIGSVYVDHPASGNRTEELGKTSIPTC